MVLTTQLLKTLILLFFVFLTPGSLFAEEVKIGQSTVFSIDKGIGSFTISERRQAIEARLKLLLKSSQYSSTKLSISEFENSTNVLYEDRILVTITDGDAKKSGVSRSTLGSEIKNKIQSVLERERYARAPKKLLLSIAYTVIATLLLIFILAFFSKSFPLVRKSLIAWKGTRIPSVRIKGYELLPASRIVGLVIWLLGALRLLLTLLIIYFYIPLVFSFFPYTSDWADKIYGYIANPISQVSKVIVDYIPNLFFVAIILIITSYALRFLKFIFSEIDRGSVKFSGFYSDWAIPTYKLIRFFIFAFTLVVIFPYLPGSGSPAFQGISVFLGILVSFGSSSAISNIVGGIVLTYMRPFKVGDRVKIADTIGDVVEKNLLVTRVRTIKNVDVTIPNSMVLGSHIINHSSSAKETGLILNTTITLGYDLDWRRVHKALIEAASEVSGVLKFPEPFVLQKSLDDFYVSYELNAYIDQPGKMASIYSNLHESIQDKCVQNGIEIMSPHYSAIRDGSELTIPGKGKTFGSAMRVSRVDFEDV